jgi:hypothetical protein
MIRIKTTQAANKVINIYRLDETRNNVFWIASIANINYMW